MAEEDALLAFQGLILDGMFDPLFDIYQNVESSKELWDSLEAKYIVEDVSSKTFLDIDKPKGNNVDGPSVVNIVEHNNSTRAVVRLLDPKLKTLGERGIECIFVGYTENSKAFRFYVIEPNELVLIKSIIESRDAIFDENRLSSVPRPSLRISTGTENIGGSVVPKEVEQGMRSLTNTPIALMLRKPMDNTNRVTEHPDSNSGKREFRSLMKFRSNLSDDVSLAGQLTSGPLQFEPSAGILFNAAAMKHMALYFAKIDKFERGLILDGLSNPLFDIYQNVESSKELWDSLEAKYIVEYVSSKTFLDIDKPKGNNVVGPSVVNMVEHNNSTRMMMLRDGLTQEQLCILGHVHYKRMRDMSKDGLILDFDMDTEKCIECIFVGYAENSKAFRFYVIEPNESVLINSIIESMDAIFDENRFSSVPRPSLRISTGTEDIGTRDEVSDQHSYCFNVEDDLKTFDEAMKSHDVAF
ncbi:hypothetical protein Tco_1506443 [Tanacetum coccineum]